MPSLAVNQERTCGRNEFGRRRILRFIALAGHGTFKLLLAALPHQRLLWKEPTVDDFTRVKQQLTIGEDLSRADWI